MVVADAFQLLRSIRLSPDITIDVILLAPPWGGIDYSESEFDLRCMGAIGDAIELLKLALSVSRHAVMILPRNTKKKQLEEAHIETSVYCYVEDIFLWGKHKMTVAYFGPSFQKRLETRK
jgi:hypothetical protein